MADSDQPNRSQAKNLQLLAQLQQEYYHLNEQYGKFHQNLLQFKQDKSMLAEIEDLSVLQAELQDLQEALQTHESLLTKVQQEPGQADFDALQTTSERLTDRLTQYEQKLATHKATAYHKMVQKVSPKPTYLKNAAAAFVVGGLICVLGQGFINFFVSTGLTPKIATVATAAVLVFLGALFTGLGIYDSLGKFAGAGSIVPITGFANSIVASAMEFKSEGFVYGIGARVFTIAGPVILYGVMVSIIIGLTFLLLQ